MNDIKTLADFKAALKEHNEAYFFFYSNGCESCRELKPKALIFEVKHPEIPFYRISTYNRRELTESLKIDFIPYLIHLKNGKVVKMDGADEIAKYLDERFI
jgi:hypothetical protein